MEMMYQWLVEKSPKLIGCWPTRRRTYTVKIQKFKVLHAYFTSR